MNEEEFREAIVKAAKSWIGTPYTCVGRIKGVGSNCAQFLYAVAKEARAIPLDAPEPRWYTPQLATHNKEERLLDYIKSYGAVEIPESDVKKGDIIVFKTGLAHGHAGIVVEWPRCIIHITPASGCQMSGGRDGRLGSLHKAFLTMWK